MKERKKMGLNRAILNFITDNNVEINDKRICLYGNLYLSRGTREIRQRLNTKLASTYLLDLGASEVIMLDINAQDGALPVNLARPIKDSNLLDSFDLLLDGGTTEHVENQRNCFKNAFNLCKSGALMVHMVPVEGHWQWGIHRHGLYRYSKEYFIELARRCNYEIIDICISDWVSRRMKDRRDLVFACLRKREESKFVWKED